MVLIGEEEVSMEKWKVFFPTKKKKKKGEDNIPQLHDFFLTNNSSYHQM